MRPKTKFLVTVIFLLIGGLLDFLLVTQLQYGITESTVFVAVVVGFTLVEIVLDNASI
ncbi:hypothetical protein [Haladaptatus sp. R4]|uniref:hypothetical protein n=1 Tax=Haladaptatus sp. R4 TaxID=1679489 RepID=UPI00168143E0|nr:hypothetical protein [Haladaptatus sp. R4]